jgi:hypothetical protein
LFGDVAIEAWPSEEAGATAEPWASFVVARRHLADGDQDLAIRTWATIAHPISPWESRHVLQAWTFLRSCNVHPDPTIAGEVLGVVAEVAIDGGHDVLAAYADGSVRFLHHLGAVSVLDPALDDVDRAAAAWRTTAQAAADAIGPADGALPPLPVGHTRFTMLTRGGHRFGQGPEQAMRADPLAGGLLAGATALLQAVVAA